MDSALIVGLAIFAVFLMIMVCWLLVRQVTKLEHELTALRAEMRTELRAQAEAVATLRNETIPALADTQVTLRRVESETRNADALLDVATSVAGTTDAASKLAYRAITNPVIKVAAALTGAKRAAQTLASPAPKSQRMTRTERRKAITVSSIDSTNSTNSTNSTDSVGSKRGAKRV